MYIVNKINVFLYNTIVLLPITAFFKNIIATLKIITYNALYVIEG
jgi:hypothetical protein